MNILTTVCRILNCLLALWLLTACDSGLNNEPPLHDAAYRGNTDKVAELLAQGVYVDSTNSQGATALHWAAFKGHTDVARLLLNHGANVNALTTKGSTPLRLASTHKQEEVIKLLKARGASTEPP